MTQTSSSSKKKLSKKHIIIEVLICVFTILSAVTLIAPFLLIPIAFAYPIIVSKPKLLYIPVGLGFAVLLFLLFNDTDLIFLFLFLFTLVGAFGIGAGFLIRYFRISKKRVKFLAITVGIITLFVPIVFIIELFTGLIRTPFVQLYFRSYIARNYADFDLVIGRPSLHFQLQTFISQIHDRNNPSLRFTLSLDTYGLRDSFTSGYFWSRTLDYILTPLLEEEFGDEFYRFSSTISGVQNGQPFDLTANNIHTLTSTITIITECYAPETLTEKIMRYHAFIIENGFRFTELRFNFIHPDYGFDHRVFIRITSPQIINEDLHSRIEHAHNNRNQHGGSFQGGDFSYSSNIDFTP